MSVDCPLLIRSGTVVPITSRKRLTGAVLRSGPPPTLDHGAGAVDGWAGHEGGPQAPVRLTGSTIHGSDGWDAEPLANPAGVVVFGLGAECVGPALVGGTGVVESTGPATDGAARLGAGVGRTGAAIAGRLGWS